MKDLLKTSAMLLLILVVSCTDERFEDVDTADIAAPRVTQEKVAAISSPSVYKGILRFENRKSYDHLIGQLTDTDDQEASVKAFVSVFSDFRSLPAQFDIAMAEIDSGRFASVEQLLAEYGDVVAIDEQSGEPELIEVNEDPIIGGLLNHEGLVIIGSDVLKYKRDVLITANIQNLDLLRSNSLDKLEYEITPIIRFELESEVGRIENDATDFDVNQYYNNNDKRVKGRVFLSIVGSDYRITLLTSHWEKNWLGNWKQKKAKRLWLVYDAYEYYNVVNSYDSGRKQDKEKISRSVDVCFNGYPFQGCTWGFVTTHGCKSNAGTDYNVYLNEPALTHTP